MYIFKWLVAGAGPDFSRANFCFGGEASKPRAEGFANPATQARS